MAVVTFESIRKNAEIKAYIEAANQVLGAVGYTEHGFPHALRTADIAARILRETGYDERTCELGQIAGYMHDIGNMLNREKHAQTGAVMAFTILQRLEMSPAEVITVSSAIGHHDESSAAPVNPAAAALIIADKSDVRRSRVRTVGGGNLEKDIHDRVNYAVQKTELKFNAAENTMILRMLIDTSICPVMDYFKIFINRMMLCRDAAAYFGKSFELLINNSRLL